jgi:uncharacterized protein YcbK (DUF882 family)
VTSLLVVAGAHSVHDAAAVNETRTISLHHTHSGEDLTVTFKRNGRYDEEALKKLNHHLRDWRSQDSTTMDRQLFDILWEVNREVGGKQPINIISAYRSPATNAMLRRRSSGVARFSQHMRGHAIDFYIPGVALSDVRAAGLRLQRGGVGFYPTSGSPFVHLDTGSVRHWPRMTHDQLARIFPDGRTVHLASDGSTLRNYQLAAADIERRGKSGASSSVSGGKSGNFLASLFGSKQADEEDESAPAETAAPGPRRVAEAAPAAKPADNVPLPRIRPAGSYQVAAAGPAPSAREPQAGAQPRPQSVTDIINARGFWGPEPAPARAPAAQTAMAKPASAKPAAKQTASDPDNAFSARFAFADTPTTASLNADIKPWSADDKPSRAQAEALAYAPPAAAIDRSKIVTASAPMPRSIRPASAARNPMAVSVDTVVAKGVQPVPATLTRVSAKPGHDPWMRAMVLAPSTYRFMMASTMGEPDMTALRALFVKPQSAIAMGFSDDPTPGLICEAFTGAATATLTTMSFRMRTAALR